MKKETGRKLGMALCAVVMLLGVAALVIYIGGFGEKIVELLPFGEDDTTETTTQLEQSVFAQSPAEGFSAVWLEYGVDFEDIASANSALDKIAEWGFKMAVFKGCDSEALSALSQYAEYKGIFSVAFVDAYDVISGGAADTAAIKAVALSSAKGVLIDFRGGFSEREISNTAKAFRLANSEIYLGIYSAAQLNYKAVCSAGIFDFKYVDITVPTAKVGGDYSLWLSNYIDGTTRDTVFGIHTELLGNTEGYEEPEEIMSQLETVSQINSFGFGIYRYGILQKNESLADAVKEYIATGLIKDFFKELVISKPAKTAFTTDESNISFVGTADITKPLTINGQAVQMIDDGYFSVELALNIGENTFTFSHKDQSITYKITYAPQLIKSVEPSGAVNAPGESSLDIVAVAHKSASVKATVNGATVSLVRSDEYDDESASDNGSDYTYFVGTYTLPAAKSTAQSLGKIKCTATYSGQTQTLSGGNVTVNAEEKIELPPVVEVDTSASAAATETETSAVTQPDASSDSSESSDNSQSDSSETEASTSTQTSKPAQSETPSLFELLTPYNYNGVSGKSKMVVVKTDLAETLPKTTTNDVSVPYYTPLPAGTVDYVTGTMAYSGINYYVLASGRRVYQKDVEYLSSGYNMPANEIKTVSVEKNSRSTDITFTMKWKVPFNIRENPQKFFTQTQGRPYSVERFTAEYVDIVFYYTTSVDAAPQFSSSVVSRAVWLEDNTESTRTLRLFLKKTGGFYGIKYYYNSDGTITFSIKERASTAVAGKVIMLDAGHGGNDPGAIGTTIVGSTHIYESTINLALANKMKALLEDLGATVIMTRSSAGQTLSLESRAAACRSRNPDIFVSIHCDASESQSPSGTTAYYYKSYSQPLANYIGQGIVSAYKSTVYSSNSAMAANVDKGNKFKGFKVTRVEECPSVLIEFGYVTNVVECNALSLDKNQSALAQGAVNGIVDYFKNS